MTTSRLERKIKEDPLAWGTPEMIRMAKLRKKSGLSYNLNLDSMGKEASAMEQSNQPSPAPKEKAVIEVAESKAPSKPTETVIYPKIRAKYDIKIQRVLDSNTTSQSDKKVKIKSLELRYQSEVKEKKYQKYTSWSLAGFLAITVTLIYAKHTLI